MLDGIVLVCVGAGILLSGPRLTGSVGCFSRFSPLAGCWAHLGVVGVSYVEMLILYEFWAWDRLVLEKAVPGVDGFDASISVSAVPSGVGINFGVLVALLDAC